MRFSPSVPPARHSKRLVIGVAALTVLTMGGSAGAVIAASLNAETSPSASLSAQRGGVGDDVSLSLGLVQADDVYAATVRVTYDASLLAVDPDAINSDVDGMWSAVGDAAEDEGVVDFTITRLGTSDGLAEELSLGSLGFFAIAPGTASIAVTDFELIGSTLERRIDSNPQELTFVIDTPTLPEPEPSPPVAPPTEPEAPAPAPSTQPEQPTVRPVPPGGGSFVRTGGTGRTGASTQTFAAPELHAPTNGAETISVVVTPNPVEAGAEATFALEGARPSTEHQIELVADGRVLGAARTDVNGTARVTAEVPTELTDGEHEVAVTVDANPVASTMLSVIAASEETPTPSPSATPRADEGESSDDTEEISSASEASSVWPWIVGALLVAALVITVLTMVARRAGRGAQQ